MFMIPDSPPAIVAPASTNYNQVCFTKDLQNCEPQSVWRAFEEISQIYRESGHCAQISSYIQSRLLKDGFEVDRKSDGTILATRGLNKEKTNAIILQSHMDIVGVSADGNAKKPINFVLKGNFLYANNRTLGADNGIGVAAMLALAEDARFKNAPLELIFTTDEETGMYGAVSLKKKDFFGKYLINLDSEQYGEIVTGCAGIVKFKIKETLPFCQLKNSSDFKQITITLSGARGGHSAEMQTDTINPILILLKELAQVKDLKLVSLSGGERENSIPRDAQVVFLIPSEKSEKTAAKLESDFRKLKEENIKNNPDLSYSISINQPIDATNYIDSKMQTRLLNELNKVPAGLFHEHNNGKKGVNDLTSAKVTTSDGKKTSQNLGVINISNGEFYIEVMGRSSYPNDLQALNNKTSEVFSKLFGKEIKANETSAIWNSKSSSQLEKVAIENYTEIPDCKKPEIKVEHGGLEPAIFIETKPDLDIISIGPTINEPHSVQECVKTDTVEPFYKWLSRIIEELANRH